ncbi:glycosyl transferase [Ferruginibacter lapsinanis]|uniref:glycosyltransferase family protein n=1 Tax=Ferruginibacter lapsinanis TaxID=563172 RepID=UPI001E4CA99F|nr:glycosyltransferase family protein [Ferruginibacter lapsinanis]UEG49289.1 glycosyl transferase [Ferruginibacter lapsinanis]
MKIFYAVQATGNGHIARAIELMPYLQQYGEVDIFLSGSNSSLDTSQKLPVKYRSKGVSLFYSNKGGLDYWKMLKHFSPLKVFKEAKDLPVEKYDIVINDFESITSHACRMKNIPSVNFGHQASFMSDKVPRPKKKNFAGELILKKYAPARSYIGLHFEQYDDFILSPVIKNKILSARPADKGHVTVYLPHYSDLQLAKKLKNLKDIEFEVFSKRVKQKEVNKNITFLPIDNNGFNESMIHSKGIITGAGFETPAEALYLGKKLMVLPIKGQYEQLCNAEALKNFNVPVLEEMDALFSNSVKQWLDSEQKKLTLQYSTESIVSKVIYTARGLREDRSNQLSTYLDIHPSLSRLLLD